LWEDKAVKKVMLIYNPLSGNRNVPKMLDNIIERFMDENIVVLPFRVNEENNESILELLKNGDFSSVILSGGDGTINSIVNTMLKNDINLPLGIIPAGTCNDFARSLGIPSDLKQCLDIIIRGKTEDVDIGLINGEKYFLNTCAGGVFVDVSFSTNNELKKAIGPLAYYLKGIAEVPSVRPIKLKITTDDKVIEDEFLLFVILNGKHVGGFSNINEDGDLSDGYMDIVLIKYCLHIDMVGLFFKAINKDFMSDKNVLCLRTKKCTIEGPDDFNLSIDGERWDNLPISVEFFNKVLKVYV